MQQKFNVQIFALILESTGIKRTILIHVDLKRILWTWGLKLIDSAECQELTKLKSSQKALKIENIVELKSPSRATRDGFYISSNYPKP